MRLHDNKQPSTSGKGRIDLGVFLDTNRDDLRRDWPLDNAQTPVGHRWKPVVRSVSDDRLYCALSTLLKGRAANPWIAA